MTCSHRLLLALSLVTAAACTSDVSDVPARLEVLVRDSAGIRVVESHVPGGVAPAYAELGEPDLEIGVVDGDPAYSFTRVVSVRSLSDGGLVIADAGAQELRAFDATGTHLRTFGGPGGGPGEFGMLSGLAGVDGDTILAWDGRNGRLSRFLADGRFLDDSTLGSNAFSIREMTYLGGGTLLAESLDVPRSDPDFDLIRTSQVVRLIGSAGRMDTVAVLPGEELRRGEPQTVTLPDGRTQRMVMLSGPLISNRVFTVGDVDHVFVGYNRSYAIERRLPSGEPDLILRVPDLDHPLEESIADEISQRRLDQCTNAACRSSVEESVDLFELPELRPAYSDLQLDALGLLWVAEWESESERVSGWHVFSGDGELLGRVTTPVGLEVHEIGSDYVLGVQENEVDVPFVRRFPLHRLR